MLNFNVFAILIEDNGIYIFEINIKIDEFIEKFNLKIKYIKILV